MNINTAPINITGMIILAKLQTMSLVFDGGIISISTGASAFKPWS